MNTGLISYNQPMDSKSLWSAVNVLQQTYPLLEVSTIGKSMLGVEIPLLAIGTGKKHILMVGAHHGMEWITSLLLIKYVEELCDSVTNKRKRYRYDMGLCAETHRVLVIPMLNPDGVDYQIHGVLRENPLYERVLRMNGGSDDFTKWQANARGVDLNHNYDCGFSEYKELEREADLQDGAPTRYSGMAPESEPETSALCRYLRSDLHICMILTLHTQGEEIYYTSGSRTAPDSLAIAKRLSLLSGYRLAKPEGMAAFGGLTDWFIQEFDKPSFTVECGFGTNPLPIGDFAGIYRDLREMLFTAPMLV